MCILQLVLTTDLPEFSRRTTMALSDGSFSILSLTSYRQRTDVTPHSIALEHCMLPSSHTDLKELQLFLWTPEEGMFENGCCWRAYIWFCTYHPFNQITSNHVLYKHKHSQVFNKLCFFFVCILFSFYMSNQIYSFDVVSSFNNISN